MPPLPSRRRRSALVKVDSNAGTQRKVAIGTTYCLARLDPVKLCHYSPPAWIARRATGVLSLLPHQGCNSQRKAAYDAQRVAPQTVGGGNMTLARERSRDASNYERFRPRRIAIPSRRH